jgi:O-antigen/teichoic acid export membrane protein
MVVRGLGAVSILILYFVVAKLYSSHDASYIFLLCTISALATPILMLGLNTHLVKKVASAKTQADAGLVMLSAIRRYASVAGPIAAVALSSGAIACYFGLVPLPSLLSISAIFFVIPASSLVAYYFQGQGSYSLSIFILNICNNAFLCGAFALHAAVSREHGQTDTDILFFLAAVATACLAVSLLALRKEVRDALFSKEQMSDAESKAQNSEIKTFWLVLVFINVNTWLPQLAFYLFGAGSDYAYYSVSERTANAINFFSIVSNFFIAPVAAQLYSAGKTADLRTKFTNVTRSMTAAALPVTLGLVLFPGWVLSQFGPGYAGAEELLIVMCIAQFFNVATGSLNTLLNMTGSQKELLRTILIALAVEVMTMAALAPFWGGLGFALAYAAAIVTQNTLAAIYVDRKLGISMAAVFLPFVRPAPQSSGDGSNK